MQNYTRIILIVIVLIIVLVIPAIQIYNYKAFEYELKGTILQQVFAPLENIKDEQAIVVKEKIVALITEAGYTAVNQDINITAYLPGPPRAMSTEIFQITSPGLKQAEIRTVIKITTKLLFFERVKEIEYTKTLKI